MATYMKYLYVLSKKEKKKGRKKHPLHFNCELVAEKYGDSYWIGNYDFFELMLKNKLSGTSSY